MQHVPKKFLASEAPLLPSLTCLPWPFFSYTPSGKERSKLLAYCSKPVNLGNVSGTNQPSGTAKSRDLDGTARQTKTPPVQFGGIVHRTVPAGQKNLDRAVDFTWT